MSRARTQAQQPTVSEVLPVPALVLAHHGETIFPLVKQWREEKRVPPVLLITGTQGIGKRSIAYFLAQWLLCKNAGFSNQNERSDGDELTSDLFGSNAPATENNRPYVTPEMSEGPCGNCTACQKALKAQWVDFKEITSELNDDGDAGKLKIDQFRQLIASMGFGAHESTYRITLIRDADLMTPQAANSVLKLLEEPPRGWVFFLTASDPSLLLPTLVSRCQKLRIKPFSEAELVTLLQASDVPADRHAVCATSAQGSWKKAIHLGDDEAWERRSAVLSFLENPASDLNSVLDWASKSTENLATLLDHLEQFSESLIRWTLAPETPLPRALAAHAKTLTQKFGSTTRAREFWIERSERMARMRQEMRAPLNKKLMVQDILLPYLSP